jgi:O-antigen/teichoic acid export membrane protein
VAGSVTLITAPISGAIMPRMAKLEAEGDHEGLIRVYRNSTQLVTVIAGSAAITMAFCAEPFLWAWTGDRVLAYQATPVLILYALGYSIVAVGAFPYYLQYAKGDLRLHLIGNAVFIILLLPSIVLAASQYGGVGAGYVWLFVNLLSFVAWLPLIHRKFEPGLNLKWYFQDIGPIFFVVLVTGLGLRELISFSNNRFHDFALVLVFGLLMLLAGSIASSEMRVRGRKWLMQYQKRVRLYFSDGF